MKLAGTQCTTTLGCDLQYQNLQYQISSISKSSISCLIFCFICQRVTLALFNNSVLQHSHDPVVSIVKNRVKAYDHFLWCTVSLHYALFRLQISEDVGSYMFFTLSVGPVFAHSVSVHTHPCLLHACTRPLLGVYCILLSLMWSWYVELPPLPLSPTHILMCFTLIFWPA